MAEDFDDIELVEEEGKQKELELQKEPVLLKV